ncbi:hypothetical protein LSAT2_017777 [Lamellibrachia satsuma]|nr:hypothetical protein LSAT2_017777 [Lamellibrachia satsuma]
MVTHFRIYRILRSRQCHDEMMTNNQGMKVWWRSVAQAVGIWSINAAKGDIVQALKKKKAPENEVKAAVTQLKHRKKLEDTILDMTKQLEGEIVDRVKLEDLFKQVLRHELVQLWRCGSIVTVVMLQVV